MADNKGVLVFCEIVEGKLAPVALEALGGGCRLATDLGEELYAVLIGENVSRPANNAPCTVAEDAIAYGANKVYVVDDPLLRTYELDPYLTVLEKLVKEIKPQIVLMGQTAIGRDLAPRLAFRLATTATLDCIALSINPETKKLWQTKPVYGGNAQAIFTSDTYPQVVTVRVKTMSALERNASKQGQVITVAAGLTGAARTRVLQKVKEEVEGIKLEDATIVVSGGRGIGGPEGFKELEKLAKALKGAVGASRPPCDSGWVPAGLQVGLTGKIIAPTLYIAIAISGSSQHMSGCSGSKTIVAINKDAEANIVKQARYAVIGDWKKVLPPFANKVKELIGG